MLPALALRDSAKSAAYLGPFCAASVVTMGLFATFWGEHLFTLSCSIGPHVTYALAYPCLPSRGARSLSSPCAFVTSLDIFRLLSLPFLAIMCHVHLRENAIVLHDFANKRLTTERNRRDNKTIGVNAQHAAAHIVYLVIYVFRDWSGVVDSLRLERIGCCISLEKRPSSLPQWLGRSVGALE